MLSVEPVPPVSSCTSTMLGLCGRVSRTWRPTLRTVGQALFGLAMLLIITGIALCIWGYLGTAIRPFQIYGPVCIGAGLAVYVIGCILCCRDYPIYERRLAEQQKKEDVRKALDTLKDKDMIAWLQGEPELHEEFRALAKEIINDHGLFSRGEDENVIANLYVNQLCPEV